VRAAQNIDCGAPIASEGFHNASNIEPFCYAYFTYPNGTSPQDTCDRKYPGSVVQFCNVNYTGVPGYWGNYGYYGEGSSLE
ncbi:hypothetical protein AAVH_30471, partial [Aphelenchoides avenae]